MVDKYAKHLENRDINETTKEVWAIQDVPKAWRNDTRDMVVSDGYYFDNQGTAHKKEQ